MMTAKVLKNLPFAATAAACTLVGLTLNPIQVEAATISQTLPEFNFDGSSPFPNSPQTIGSYSFSIPTGEEIVSAVIRGTFGNRTVTNTAPVQVFLDGLNVATCLASEPCYSTQVPLLWSFTFAPSQFSLLADGSGLLTSIQNDEFFTRLGATTLTIETATVSTAVPTPALLPGLVGIGVAALRKRKAAVEGVGKA
jgi:hypothetical protein